VRVGRSRSQDGSGVAAEVILQAGRTYIFEIAGSCGEEAVLSVKERRGSFILRGPALSWRHATSAICFTAPSDGQYELRLLFSSKATVDAVALLTQFSLAETVWQVNAQGSAALRIVSGSLSGDISYRVTVSGVDASEMIGVMCRSSGDDEPATIPLTSATDASCSAFLSHEQAEELHVTAATVPPGMAFLALVEPAYANLDPSSSSGSIDIFVLVAADPIRAGKVVSQLWAPSANIVLVHSAMNGTPALPTRLKLPNIYYFEGGASWIARIFRHAAATGRTCLICSASYDYPPDFLSKLQEGLQMWRGSVILSMSGSRSLPSDDGEEVDAEGASDQAVLLGVKPEVLAFDGRTLAAVNLDNIVDGDAVSLSTELLLAGIPVVTPARARRWLRRIA